MSADYTPHTGLVRHVYAYGLATAEAEFDRWLKSIKAEAWDEGSRSSMFTGAAARNPYRSES